MKTKIFIVLLITMLSANALLAEIKIQLAKDINTGKWMSCSSTPVSFVRSGSITYFVATTGDYGRELWRTDGTSAGTTMVKDIHEGLPDSDPDNLTDVNGILYFVAYDGIRGRELWKSDGTSLGTTLVMDIRSGPASSFLNGLINISGTLYFSANDYTNGFELWKKTASDPPIMITDYRGTSNTRRSDGSIPLFLTNVGGRLYYTAMGANGNELYYLNGNTPVLIDVNNVGQDGSSPSSLVNINGTLFFSATRTGMGRELFRYNGTVLEWDDIVLGTGSSFPQYLTNVNGTLFFTATTSATGRELYRRTTTGTPESLDHIYTGPSSADPQLLTAVGSTCYFTAYNGLTTGREVYKCGISGTPSLVKDITTGTATSAPSELVNVNGVLYFIARDDQGVFQIWRSTDGTSANTKTVSSFLLCGDSGGEFSASAPTKAHDLTNINGVLYFGASTCAIEDEPHKITGPTAGVVLVKDVGFCPESSHPKDMIALGTTLYFTAKSANNGRDIWKKIHGSEVYEQDNFIAPGSASSNPENLTNVNNITLYFSAESSTHGRELWRTTTLGTSGYERVTDLISGSGSSNPEYLTNVNGVLYFAATGPQGRKLYRVASPTSGAQIVNDIYTNEGSSPSYYYRDPQNLINVNGKLYFSALSDLRGRELYQVTGPAALVDLVSDINDGGFGNSNASSSPRNFTNVNGKLYFIADNAGHGPSQLYRRNTSGVNLTRISIGTGTSAYPSNLASVGSVLYFSAFDDINGRELWRYKEGDGVSMVKNIAAEDAGSSPQNLVNVDGTLFFTADDGEHGREVWRSNGTEAGTKLMRDIKRGPESSEPRDLTNISLGNYLYFSAIENSDRVVFKSEGTECGTLSRLFSAPGSSVSVPAHFTHVSYHYNVYFSATGWVNTSGNPGPFVGTELFMVPHHVTTSPCPSSKMSEEGITPIPPEAEKIASLTLNAYPNPAREQLKMSITAEEARKGTLMVFDISGKQLEDISLALQQGNNEVTIKTQDLPDGMYFIRYADEKEQKAMQFVVQH